MKVIPDPTGPGRENVWSSYPRPAVAEPSQRHLKIVRRDVIIADTRKGIRTLETSHPAQLLLSTGRYRTVRPTAVAPAHILRMEGRSDLLRCPRARRNAARCGLELSRSEPGLQILARSRGLYAWPFAGCFVDDERVTPQPGKFYGGWISSDVAGPFKGAPGTRFW